MAVLAESPFTRIVAVTVRSCVALAARLPSVQVSVLPETDGLLGSALRKLRLSGSVSTTCTPVASLGPLLTTWSAKVICSPTSILLVGPTTVLVMARSAASGLIVTLAVLSPELYWSCLALTPLVIGSFRLLRTLGVTPTTVAVTWKVATSPSGSAGIVQVSVLPETLAVAEPEEDR